MSEVSTTARNTGLAVFGPNLKVKELSTSKEISQKERKMVVEPISPKLAKSTEAFGEMICRMVLEKSCSKMERYFRETSHKALSKALENFSQRKASFSAVTGNSA